MILNPIPKEILTRTDRTTSGRITHYAGKIPVSRVAAPLGALSLIMKLTPKAKEMYPPGTVDFDFSRLYFVDEKKVFEGAILYMYDVKNAYPRFAFDLGIIDKEEFKAIYRLPKEFRLMVLGALSTEKESIYYLAGEEKERREKPRKSDAFIAIAKAMNEALEPLKEGAAMQYADALFFSEPRGRKIRLNENAYLRFKNVVIVKAAEVYALSPVAPVMLVKTINEKAEIKAYAFHIG